MAAQKPGRPDRAVVADRADRTTTGTARYCSWVRFRRALQLAGPLIADRPDVARRMPEDLAVAFGDFEGAQPSTPAWPAGAAPGRRLVDRTVHRTDDELALAVEEFAGLPVHLGRHVHAAVQVGDDASVEPQRERARRLAVAEDVKDNRLSSLGEI